MNYSKKWINKNVSNSQPVSGVSSELKLSQSGSDKSTTRSDRQDLYEFHQSAMPLRQAQTLQNEGFVHVKSETNSTKQNITNINQKKLTVTSSVADKWDGSSPLLEGLEFLQSQTVIDPSVFVTNFAPLEPYTILPLSFRSCLPLDILSNIISKFMKDNETFTFQFFASESVWYINHTNGHCSMQVQIYRGKSGHDHVIEAQRCDGDSFTANSLFYAIKSAITQTEFPEMGQARPSMDYMHLISV